MDNEKNSVAIIYSVVKESLGLQQEQKKTLENKASTLIAFSAGIFALLMGSYDTLITFPPASQVTILIAIIFFVISVLFSTLAGWVQKYRVDPNPKTLAEKYLEEFEENTKLQLISNWIGVWEQNSKTLEFKATFIRISFISQVIGFVLLGIALYTSILR